jgi:hypothetical protein
MCLNAAVAANVSSHLLHRRGIGDEEMHSFLLSWFERDANLNKTTRIDSSANFSSKLYGLRFSWEEADMASSFKRRRATKVTVSSQELESRTGKAHDRLTTTK